MAVITGGDLRGLGSRSSFARRRLDQKSSAGLSDAQRVANTTLLNKCIDDVNQTACSQLEAIGIAVPACAVRAQQMSKADQAAGFATVMGCMATLQACSETRKATPTAKCPGVKSACAPMKSMIVGMCPEGFAPPSPRGKPPTHVPQPPGRPKPKPETDNTILILGLAAAVVVGTLFVMRK